MGRIGLAEVALAEGEDRRSSTALTNQSIGVVAVVVQNMRRQDGLVGASGECDGRLDMTDTPLDGESAGGLAEEEARA